MPISARIFHNSFMSLATILLFELMEHERMTKNDKISVLIIAATKTFTLFSKSNTYTVTCK